MDKSAHQRITSEGMDMDKRLIDTLDQDQRRRLEDVRQAVENIWSRPLHRYYIDHSLAHSERVIALLDGLTAGIMSTDKRLSRTEVYILLAAAYLHDIGMQNEQFAEGDLETIRAHHHEQTAEMIYQSFERRDQAFALPPLGDPTIVDTVACVAKGHQEEINLHSTEYTVELTYGSGSDAERVRPQLLAALLRFADALDIDHNRVHIEQLKLLAVPVESQLPWWMCHYVNGVSIEDEYIRIEYRFPRKRPDYEELIVPQVERDIRAKHAALGEIFRMNRVKVAVARGRPRIRWMRLMEPLPKDVETLARKYLVPDLLTQPEFWNSFAVIMSFGKVVHTAFQGLDFAYGNKLLEQAANIVKYPADESLLNEFTNTWQDFSQHYRSYIEKKLFEPSERREAWVRRVDNAFQYLRAGATRVETSVETLARTIDSSSGFYQEIKKQLVEYPELMRDIDDVVSGPRVGAASQWDRGKLRQTIASFSEDEMRHLCAELNQVECQDLPRESRAARARALVDDFGRRDRFPELVAACCALRPTIQPDLFNVPYATQLATKARDLINKVTRPLALSADKLIQYLVEIIVPKEGDGYESLDNH
jgi:hypothetical protein